jgi:hypothetical protein
VQRQVIKEEFLCQAKLVGKTKINYYCFDVGGSSFLTGGFASKHCSPWQG